MCEVTVCLSNAASDFNLTGSCIVTFTNRSTGDIDVNAYVTDLPKQNDHLVVDLHIIFQE